MTVTFPRRRADGTFSFVAKYSFRVPSEDPTRELTVWLRAWVDRNVECVWRRSSGTATEQGVRSFFEDFSRVPYVSDWSPLVVSIRFDARAEAQEWKNWLVRISRDLLATHPNIERLVGSESVET